jgi:hypothetical protein
MHLITEEERAEQIRQYEAYRQRRREVHQRQRELERQRERAIEEERLAHAQRLARERWDQEDALSRERERQRLRKEVEYEIALARDLNPCFPLNARDTRLLVAHQEGWRQEKLLRAATEGARRVLDLLFPLVPFSQLEPAPSDQLERWLHTRRVKVPSETLRRQNQARWAREAQAWEEREREEDDE